MYSAKLMADSSNTVGNTHGLVGGLDAIGMLVDDANWMTGTLIAAHND